MTECNCPAGVGHGGHYGDCPRRVGERRSGPRFEDTDPRPRDAWLAHPQRRGDVSPGFARQRAEIEHATEKTAEHFDEMRRVVGELASAYKPPPPEGYEEVVAEANRRAAAAEPLDGRTQRLVFALRRAYVVGFVDHWLSTR